MSAIADQREKGISYEDLVGPADVAKVYFSARHFQKASLRISDDEVNQVCNRVLRSFSKAPPLS
jgi:hypothetical protein